MGYEISLNRLGLLICSPLYVLVAYVWDVVGHILFSELEVRGFTSVETIRRSEETQFWRVLKSVKRAREDFEKAAQIDGVTKHLSWIQDCCEEAVCIIQEAS